MSSSFARVFRVVCVVSMLVLAGSAAFGDCLFDASLRNGDYEWGTAIDTMDPDHGDSPHVLGIVDSADGVTFTSTEADGRSNGLINYALASEDRGPFRYAGTVSMWIKGDREAHVGGHLWCENYGFTAFQNGQSTISAASSQVENGPGTEDDALRISWQTWHNSVWYQIGSTDLDYGQWYHVGFAWGGATHDYEIWVDGELALSYDLPGGIDFPWGTSGSGTNWGLGDNHARGYDAYGSNVGITYAGLHIWDEYRDFGDTTGPPEAAFSATPTIGYAPLDVDFTDMSTAVPTTWEWDFGDGGTSTEQNPSHQYTAVGTYEVSLTVGDLHGEDTATEAHYIIVPFPDTPYEPTPYWSLYFVLACVDAGVVGGYDDGTYQPSWSVDRGQMSVFVSRALAEGEENVPAPTTDPGFTDVDSEHWAYKYICYAVDQNVVAGYPEGDYRPDQDVTRDQMAVYMARAMVAPTTSVLDSYTPADPENFPDVASDHWAYKYVEYCVEQGVVGGYPEGDYRPDNVVTRDQMVVYIARAFNLDMVVPTYDITDYFPLAEGDTWTYQLEAGGTATRTVSGTVEKHSRTYVRILDAAHSAGDYWLGAPEGLYHGGDFDSDEDITFDPPVLFPNGLAVGDSGAATATQYVNSVSVGDGTFGWELVAVESVTVPAGTFPGCLKVRLTPDFPDDTSDFYIWFGKDVGIVKYEGISEPDTDDMVLQSATVGGTVYP